MLLRSSNLAAMRTDRSAESRLLANLKEKLADLRTLLDQSSNHWGYEDPVYRFYHHSFKVFALQNLTEKIVAELRLLLPSRSLNAQFLEIVGEGAGKEFSPEMNATWNQHTRPIL